MRFIHGLWIIFLIAFYSIIFAQSNDGWVNIDSLHEGRRKHASVLLPNGNVLVGGGEGTSILASCEIYEVNNGKWRYTNRMNIPRAYHDMLLLRTGKILAIGGFNERSCELFDPVTETWTLTDSIPTLRFFGQSITELKDGRILVSGGYILSNDGNFEEYLSVCEIYDPVTEKWLPAASLNIGRYNHTATLLSSGEVLIAGGSAKTVGALRSCEIYNPANNTWFITASLNEPRSNAASILLPNDNVFISGGDSTGVNTIPMEKSCEVFDIKKSVWFYAENMMDRRTGHQIYNMEKTNQLLIIGGTKFLKGKLDTWETYDPVNLKPIQNGIIPVKKIYNKNTMKLKDDRIILTGGNEYDFSVWDGMLYLWSSKSCQIFDIMTSVENHQLIHDNYTLFQNYPNPFNPTTEIKYSLSKSGITKLDIFDVLGRLVKSLVNSYQIAGSYLIQFNAEELPSGIYLYRLLSGTYSETKKMLLVK